MNKGLSTKLTATFFGILLLATSVSALQTGLSKRVRFPRGGTTATLKNSLVRGTVDRYTLGVRSGQKMTVRITSLEANAIFVIYRPGGEILEGTGEGTNEKNWSGELPHSGDYVIEVGGTRGNATYTLKVTVR
jgi:hypothetical protein